MKPEKIYALMGFKCVPPVYSLLPRYQQGATTNRALKPQVRREANF